MVQRKLEKDIIKRNLKRAQYKDYNIHRYCKGDPEKVLVYSKNEKINKYPSRSPKTLIDIIFKDKSKFGWKTHKI